jgi:hypothetical protein
MLMVFHCGTSRGAVAKMSVMSRIDGRGGKMYVPRAMYSFRMSFWIVPRACRPGRPALRPRRRTAREQDRRRGVDRHRRRHAVERDLVEQDAHVGSSESMATPTLPTSPSGAGVVAVEPICVGRSNATEAGRPPCDSR